MKSVTIADLLHLSVPERLQLVQDLWDSIAADTNGEPARLPLSEEQCAVIRRRSEAHRRNPGAAIPLEEALERIERAGVTADSWRGRHHCRCRAQASLLAC